MMNGASPSAMLAPWTRLACLAHARVVARTPSVQLAHLTRLVRLARLARLIDPQHHPAPPVRSPHAGMAGSRSLGSWPRFGF